ncbi:shikimate dehydrogenase [Microvirga sp. BT688]|uniref:shikimate dehydrogenase family protein n=1 Tax=Microvirga sp. TaxID=1873136 RepID=UPI001685298A|nr:shikimate dehydrogenase [Microvirga sp.]MBD2746742.1 shikimate dehydrogenase [Microvirga sp.]
MTTEISGATKIFGIIADPIQHVQTPQVFNDVLRARGVDGVLVPFHISKDDLAACIDGLRHMRNLGGLIVTVPHKVRMLAMCDEVTERARRIEAVNVVRREHDGRLVADMLDGEGFVSGLRHGGIEPAGKRVYLAGAGGAANAIAFALADARVSHLTVANRTKIKAQELCERIREYYPDLRVDVGTDDPYGHEVLVNATSLGLCTSDPLPFDVSRLAPSSIVAEIIMKPAETSLMAVARSRGCRIHPGLPMLQSQIALLADFLKVGQ